MTIKEKIDIITKDIASDSLRRDRIFFKVICEENINTFQFKIRNDSLSLIQIDGIVPDSILSEISLYLGKPFTNLEEVFVLVEILENQCESQKIETSRGNS